MSRVDDKEDAGQYNLRLLERAGLIVVDHLEALAGRVQELVAELGVGLLRRALAPLALGGELLEALREAARDRLVPLLLVDLAALVRVEEVQGLLEARRVEQEHQVVVSAVADELDHFGVVLYGGNDFFDACVDIDQ